MAQFELVGAAQQDGEMRRDMKSLMKDGTFQKGIPPP